MAFSRTAKQNITLAGIAFLAFAIPLTVVAVHIASDIASKAKPTETPQQVFVTNLTESSATVTWVTTENETDGLVKYGVSQDSLTSSAFDERDKIDSLGLYNTHSVILRGLSADTKYYYTIMIGGEEYDNAGNPFSFSSLPSSVESPFTPDPVEGNVTPSTGDLLVYSYATDGNIRSTIVSTLTNSVGNYVFDKSSFKSLTSGEKFSMSSADIVTFVQGVGFGTAQGQYLSTSKPEIMSLSKSSVTFFNPDASITLLPREGSPSPSPSPTSSPVPASSPSSGTDTTSKKLIESFVNLSGFDSNPTIPYMIKISNISDVSFTVSWLTKEATTGSVVYGLSSPSELALDDRDGSAVLAKKRFTHSVTISKPTFKKNDKVLFEINSNSKSYKPTIGSFVFTIPAVLSSPPSIKVVTGRVTPVFETSIGLKDSRDFIIAGNYSADGKKSTWVTTVPAENKGWNLNMGSARSLDLSSLFSNSGADLNLEMYGELNSFQTTILKVDDESQEFDPEAGLTVMSFEHENEVSVLEPVKGTTIPGSTVSLAFSGPQNVTMTASADENGVWEADLSQIVVAGDYDISINSVGSVLGISATIRLDALPDTALTDYFLYIPGIILLFSGIGLIYWVKQNKIKIS
ncbi:fibronectin type III domain-containing protein [Candidatus Dojkabacteria bacterium]|nr:fibronectin type III domain-containing protein [Candidatus Dojkabacteria bacterium]